MKILDKIKENGKLILTTLALGFILMPVSHASEGTVDTAALTSALTSIADSVKGVISQVAPVALSVTAVFLVWKYGVKFFKGLLGR